MSKKIKGILLIITLAVTLVACNEESFDLSNRPDRKEEYELKEFKQENTIINSSDIEELDIEDAKILEKSNLNILYLKDGMFYGVGHHPSEDGSKIYSKYKFDFDGNIEEDLFLGDFKSAMDTDEFIWKNSGVVKRDKNEYYYVNLIDNINTIIKIDFNTMDEKVVRTFGGDVLSMYWIDDDYLYYDQDDLEGSILRLDLKTDDVYMLEEPEPFKDSYTSMLGKTGVEHKNLYYQALDGDETKLYEFNYQEGVLSTLVSVKGAGGSNITQETLERDDDHWIVFNNDENEITLVWNSTIKEMEYILKLEEEKDMEFLTSYEDRKLIYKLEEEKLLLVDIDKEIKKELDIAEILKKHDSGSYNFFIEDEYMYIQWMDQEINVGEDLKKDIFYRVKI